MYYPYNIEYTGQTHTVYKINTEITLLRGTMTCGTTVPGSLPILARFTADDWKRRQSALISDLDLRISTCLYSTPGA